ncbi:hypothetical protein V8E53_005441 [Lactarius tabidus]
MTRSGARSARVEMGGRRRARGYLISVYERKGHPRRGWPFDRDFRRRLPYILECETATFAGAHPNRTVFGLGPGSGLADGAWNIRKALHLVSARIELVRQTDYAPYTKLLTFEAICHSSGAQSTTRGFDVLGPWCIKLSASRVQICVAVIDGGSLVFLYGCVGYARGYLPS